MYWFLDDQDNVLYVGKAKNLKNRIASYKQWQQTTGKTRRLVFQATRLKHQVLTSELEALLVEAELIRTHQPPFNILLKDDKTPLYIHLTDEVFPRVLTIRKKELEKQRIPGQIFGPFPSGYKVREVLEIARRIFPYCNAPRSETFGQSSNRPCFDYHLDLCPGACVGAISAEDYRQTLQQLALFLRGKKKEVVRAMKAELKSEADAENYEAAALLRDRTTLIESVTNAKYRLKPDLQLPKLKESLRAEGLVQLRRLLCTHLALPRTFPLTRIEGYDVSNVQGQSATVALVVAVNGTAAKDQYRLFNIRTLNTPNDYGMLQEALIRRQNHQEWGVPNLIVIDGGKGQLRAVQKVWQWTTPVISIAKGPDRLIFPVVHHDEDLKTAKRTATKKHTKTFATFHEVRLEPDHPALQLIQRLRDEAHRFSKAQHHRLHERKMFAE